MFSKRKWALFKKRRDIKKNKNFFGFQCNVIRKRKFKQWRSINPPISTNEQSPLTLIHWAQKGGATIYIGNPGNSLRQAQKCGGGVIPVTL